MQSNGSSSNRHGNTPQISVTLEGRWRFLCSGVGGVVGVYSCVCVFMWCVCVCAVVSKTTLVLASLTCELIRTLRLTDGRRVGGLILEALDSCSDEIWFSFVTSNNATHQRGRADFQPTQQVCQYVWACGRNRLCTVLYEGVLGCTTKFNVSPAR